MTWTPLVLLWDFTPFELMAMWWPEGKEELFSLTNDTCIYTGWFYKLWQPKIDFEYTIPQCTIDRYSPGDGFVCEASTAAIGYLEEWKAKQLKDTPVKYRSMDGMWKSGINTCHKLDAFDARKGIERPLCWDNCDSYDVKEQNVETEEVFEQFFI